MIWMYLIIGGFIEGGIMFSYLLPKLIMQKDICMLSGDHNPGAANVFINCGIPMGLTCLTLDMAKGFFPVFLWNKICRL